MEVAHPTISMQTAIHGPCLCSLAGDLEIFNRVYGLDRALRLIEQRSGVNYPAKLARSLIACARHWLQELEQEPNSDLHDMLLTEQMRKTTTVELIDRDIQPLRPGNHSEALIQHLAVHADNLAEHQIIAMSHFGLESLEFSPAKRASIPRLVSFRPHLVANSARVAVASATEGHGITRLFSVAQQLRDGTLEILADDEPVPLPVHLISPQGRLSVPRVRAFVDFAVPRVKSAFAGMKSDSPICELQAIG